MPALVARRQLDEAVTLIARIDAPPHIATFFQLDHQLGGALLGHAQFGRQIAHAYRAGNEMLEDVAVRLTQIILRVTSETVPPQREP
jgi:hypothetical protein